MFLADKVDEEGRRLGGCARVLGGGSTKIEGLKRILAGISSWELTIGFSTKLVLVVGTTHHGLKASFWVS